MTDEIIQPHIFIKDLHQQILGPGRVVDPQHQFFFFEIRVRTSIFTSLTLFRGLAQREFDVGVLLGAERRADLGLGGVSTTHRSQEKWMTDWKCQALRN